MEDLNGTVDRFLFKSEESGFSVFVLQVKKDQTIVVRGHTPALQPGQQVELSGDWVVHPKFGKQFEAHSCQVCLPSSALGLKKYLGIMEFLQWKIQIKEKWILMLKILVV